MDTIVLVAGFNYHSLTPGTVLFSPARVARTRCAQIFSASADNQAVRAARWPVRVILMDVESGSVRAVEANGEGEPRERTLAQHAPISREHYQWVEPGRWLFCRNGEGVLSILDVYDLVKDLGRRNPGTLVELSFISHGWAGGPSLVNSDDTLDRRRIGPPAPDEPRDPADKDGRRFKDFRPPTLTADDLELMRRAFSPSSYVWNWACNNSNASADILAQAVRAEPSVLEGEPDPERSLELRFTPEQQALYFGVDGGFFPREDLTFRRSVGEVVAFLWKRIVASYNGQAALALDRPCFGPLPGMPSDIERGGSFPQMVVPHTSGYSVNRADELRFYERYLGVGFDSEGRRFGEHLAGTLRARVADGNRAGAPLR